jgi:hypothetical protein
MENAYNISEEIVRFYRSVIPIERITSRIYLIRGEKVMLDSEQTSPSSSRAPNSIL